MSSKKIRGRKRKWRNFINNLTKITSIYPVRNNELGYLNYKLPIGQDFLESSVKVKRLCIQKLLQQAKYLQEIRPNNIKDRIIVFVNLQDVWDASIIIFQNEDCFSEFISRDTEYEKWLPISEECDILKEWNIRCDVPKKGYKRMITDEEFSINDEVWLFGEI